MKIKSSQNYRSARNKKRCTWIYHVMRDETLFCVSSCGVDFTIGMNDPYYKYCPYCGGRLNEATKFDSEIVMLRNKITPPTAEKGDK